MSKKVTAVIDGTSTALPYVEINVGYTPDIAGGAANKFASEHYPLRVDYYGTLQLCATDCVDQLPYKTLILQSPEHSHNFSVRLAAHVTSQGIHAPFFEAGAYQRPLPTTTTSVGQQQQQGGDTDKVYVAHSTSIVFVFYATTFTTLAQRCWTNVGTTQIFLKDLLDGHAYTVDVVQNRSTDSDYTADVKPMLKGSLKVLQSTFRNVALRPATEFDTSETKQIDTMTFTMRRLLNRGMGMFFKDKRIRSGQSGATPFEHATEEYLGPYHVPLFQTARFPLASCTYCMLAPRQPIDVAYNEQLAQVALARSGATRKEALIWSAFLDDSTQQQQQQQPIANLARIETWAFAAICARLVSVFALSQRYMDDVLNQNRQHHEWDDRKVKPVEDFKLCRLCGGDDCEGVCLETMNHIRSLADAPAALLDTMSPLLRRVCVFLRLFVPMMTLGCVTNRKATSAPLDESNALAHTFCVMMPFWMFYNQVSAAQRIQLLQSRFYKRNKALLDRFTGANRDFFTPIIAEATAPIDPAMRPVDSYYKEVAPDETRVAIAVAKDRRALCDAMIVILDRYDLAEVLQPEMLSPPDRQTTKKDEKRDYSQFYKFFMCAQTPSFADLRRLDFAFLYKGTYGTPFSDLINKPAEFQNRDDLNIVNYLELTEEEAQIADAILLEAQPLPTLSIAPDSALNNERIRNLDAIFQKFKIPLAAQQQQAIVADTPLHRRLQYLTISAEDINEKVINAVRQISQLRQVREFNYAWYGLNKAIDGTERHNVILDIYLRF